MISSGLILAAALALLWAFLVTQVPSVSRMFAGLPMFWGWHWRRTTYLAIRAKLNYWIFGLMHEPILMRAIKSGKTTGYRQDGKKLSENKVYMASYQEGSMYKIYRTLGNTAYAEYLAIESDANHCTHLKIELSALSPELVIQL